MTVYSGVSVSNYVEVSGKESAREVIESLRESFPDAYFQTAWHEGRLKIYADNGTIALPPEPAPFLTKLATILEEPMTIRSVGFEGCRYKPDAWQITIYPDGEVTRHTLPDETERTRPKEDTLTINSVSDEDNKHYYDVGSEEIDGITVDDLNGEITIHS